MRAEEGLRAASSDDLTYRWAGTILRAGMLASLGVMCAGLVWWLLAGAPGGTSEAYTSLPIADIFPQLAAGNPLAMLDLGVLLLLATPGITLLSEIITFAAARNWRFVAVACVVAIILLTGLALSLKWIKLF